MTALRSLLLVVPLAIWLSHPSTAHADYAEAKAAVARNDFTAARKALEPLETGADARVFKLLGELNRDGKGAAPDMIAAYKDFSLFGIYTGDPDERATAFALRRQVARKLKDREPDIKQAERLVIQQVDAHLGNDERKRQVQAIKKNLAACKSRCDDIALGVYRLGPAAQDAVHELEAILTRDPYWMPRETYVYALAYIGTEGVPALARVFRNDREMASEGFWNAQHANAALQSLGPTAFSALQALAEAITRSFEGLGGEEQELAQDLAEQGPSALVFGLKVGIAQAILSIGDPQRDIHDRLYDYFIKEPDISTKLLTGWLLGLLYEEPQKALALVDSHISSTDVKVVEICLVIISDFHDIKPARPQLDALLPKVKKVAEKGPESLREFAANILESFKQ